MKSIILIISVFLFQTGRNLNCNDFHIGTFTIPNTDKLTHKIIRTETKQIEIVEDKGLQSEFDIKWLDDCNYILFNRRVTKGTDSNPKFNKDTLYNQISKIVGKDCVVTSWFSWSDKLDAKLTKVK